MRSDSYNFTHPFLRKIQGFEQDSICLIAQSQRYTYKELLDSTHNALNLLNDIKASSVIGIIGDYDLATIAFFLACVEKGFIITPLSASLAPQDSKTKSRWVTGLKAQNLGNLDSIKTKTPTAEVSLDNFKGCADSYARSFINEQTQEANHLKQTSLESAKETTQNLDSNPTNHANKTTNSSSCSVALEALADLEGRSYLSDMTIHHNSANRPNCIDKGEFLENLDSKN